MMTTIKKISTPTSKQSQTYKQDGYSDTQSHTHTYKYMQAKLFPCKAKGSDDGEVLVKDEWKV